MMDGGLNTGNVSKFVRAGMTVGEFSSPLLKGPAGKLKAGTGEIPAAVQRLRKALDEAGHNASHGHGIKTLKGRHGHTGHWPRRLRDDRQGARTCLSR